MKKYMSVYYYRMNLIFEVFKRKLANKIPIGLIKNSTLEETDSILKGLLEQSK